MDGARLGRNEPVAVRARVLAHPIALGLVAVWALNDHLLKTHAPSAFTGKLSDVAGLVVFPLLIGTLWPGARPWHAGLAITTLGFAAVNVSAPVAEVVAGGLSQLAGPSRLTPDHTDLLVLPAAAMALWIAHHPPGAPWARVVGRGALAFGLLTTVATSRIDEGTEHVIGVEGSGTGVAVAISPLQDDSAPPSCTDVWSSADGREWVRQEGRSSCPRRPRRPATPAPPITSQQACFADGGTCFRVAEDLVERSVDTGQTWTEAWRWPTDRARFDWRWCPLGCAYESRGPHAVAIATLARTETVVVAMGHEGVLLSADGVTWEQVAAGPTGDPTALTGDGPLFPEHIVVLTAAVVLLAITLQVGRLPDRYRLQVAADHPVRRRHRLWLAGWGMVVFVAAAVGGGAAFWRFSEGHIWLWIDAVRWTLITLGVISAAALAVAYLGRRASMGQLRRG